MSRGRRFGPGRIRRKLAEMIVAKLAADGLTVRVDPAKLWPAEGWWRTSMVDCWVWDGQIEVLNPPPGIPWSGNGPWKTVQIGSYDRMTDCVRGFSYANEGFSLEFNADAPKSPSERYRALRGNGERPA